VNLNGRGVPFGARGTVIGVHTGRGCVDVVMDQEFLAGKHHDPRHAFLQHSRCARSQV
jgi:hypothetical protein